MSAGNRRARANRLPVIIHCIESIFGNSFSDCVLIYLRYDMYIIVHGLVFTIAGGINIIVSVRLTTFAASIIIIDGNQQDVNF